MFFRYFAQVRKSYGEALHEVEDFFMLLMSLVVLRIGDVEAAGQAAGAFCSVFRSSKDLPEFRVKLYVLPFKFLMDCWLGWC